MPSLESVNILLTEAATFINKAAIDMKKLSINEKDDLVYEIAEALASVHNIQHRIFDVSPELMPDFLKEEMKDPIDSHDYSLALLDSMSAAKNGDFTKAILIIETFLNKERPLYLKESASELIEKYKRKNI